MALFRFVVDGFQFPPRFTPLEGFQFLAQVLQLPTRLGQFHRFFGPFDGIFKIAVFGVAGGQGAEDVRFLVIGQFRRFEGQIQSPVPVPDRIVG